MITNNKNKVIYTSDGTQTTYYFDFPVYDSSDLKVYIKEPDDIIASLLDPTNYTINFNSDYTGSITLNNPLPEGTQIALIREVELTQNMQYIEGDPFPAKSHEKALDRLTMICQQLQEQLDRTVKIEITGEKTNEIPIPLPSAYLGTNIDGKFEWKLNLPVFQVSNNIFIHYNTIQTDFTIQNGQIVCFSSQTDDGLVLLDEYTINIEDGGTLTII